MGTEPAVADADAVRDVKLRILRSRATADPLERLEPVLDIAALPKWIARSRAVRVDE